MSNISLPGSLIRPLGPVNYLTLTDPPWREQSSAADQPHPCLLTLTCLRRSQEQRKVRISLILVRYPGDLL